MYVNGKMRTVETIPGMGTGRKRRMIQGVNSTMIYCKNFGRYHMYPQYNNNLKKF
jgi:hypothetical protein